MGVSDNKHLSSAQEGIFPFSVRNGKVMMWYFVLSDVFTFSALLVAYGYIRFSAASYEGDWEAYVFSQAYWPLPEKVFNAIPFFHGLDAPLVFVGLMTFILILSSVTMVLAVEAAERCAQPEVEKWMLWTLIGGIAFLGCQAWEWTHFITGTSEGGKTLDGTTLFGASLLHNQYGPPSFANLFFLITGFHGFHVFTGVILNFVIFYMAATGELAKKKRYFLVENVGLYWHFVDLVWVFVFTFFYLI